MKKILITGNSGYIGSHLSNMLIKKSEYEIHGLDKDIPQISVYKQHCQDIRDHTWPLHEVYDCVIHLAAEVSVGRSVNNPILYYTTKHGRLYLFK
jgi:nucleoside-diphosphate-sugar epimerase